MFLAEVRLIMSEIWRIRDTILRLCELHGALCRNIRFNFSTTFSNESRAISNSILQHLVEICVLFKMDFQKIVLAKMMINNIKYDATLACGMENISGGYEKYSFKTGITKKRGQSIFGTSEFGKFDFVLVEDRPLLDVGYLSKKAYEFAVIRKWQNGDLVRNLLFALSREIGELVEIHTWKSDEFVVIGQSDVDSTMSEIADIAIYLLRLCRVVGYVPSIDIDVQHI